MRPKNIKQYDRDTYCKVKKQLTCKHPKEKSARDKTTTKVEAKMSDHSSIASTLAYSCLVFFLGSLSRVPLSPVPYMPTPFPLSQRRIDA